MKEELTRQQERREELKKEGHTPEEIDLILFKEWDKEDNWRQE